LNGSVNDYLWRQNPVGSIHNTLRIAFL